MTVVSTTMGVLKRAAAGSNETAHKMFCVLCAPLNSGTLLGRTLHQFHLVAFIFDVFRASSQILGKYITINKS
jgi:hypothetical protein